MMNPAMLFKVKGMWDQFVKNHPKFPMFLNAVKTNGVGVDSVIEICITQPDGQQIRTNVKITESDLDLINQMRDLA